MASQRTLAAAERMGTRAGQYFLEVGIWPRNPFRDETAPVVAALARAWRHALFAVVGPVIAAQQRGQFSAEMPDAYTVTFPRR